MKKLWLMTLVLPLLGTIAAFGTSGCAHEGPMERAGKHVDNTADDVKHDTKKAARDIKGD